MFRGLSKTRISNIVVIGQKIMKLPVHVELRFWMVGLDFEQPLLGVLLEEPGEGDLELELARVLLVPIVALSKQTKDLKSEK